MKTLYRLEALTPIFSYGADPFYRERANGGAIHQGTPEIRSASIRGQLRWWMEALGYSNRVGTIFGSIAGNDRGTASKVIVRVSDINGTVGRKRSTQQHHWSTKPCFLPETTFSLHLKERFGGLCSEDREVLSNTVEAWILLGTLGGRGTRAGGSLIDSENLLSEADWSNRIPQLFEESSHLKVRLGKSHFSSESEARLMICDTLEENAFPRGEKPLGGITPRKTSPLRMRVVRFSDPNQLRLYRIAFVWTEKSIDPLKRAIEELKQEMKRIGTELEEASLIR